MRRQRRRCPKSDPGPPAEVCRSTRQDRLPLPNDVIDAIPNVLAARLEQVLGPSIRNRAEVALVLELVYSTLISAVVGRGAQVETMRADLRTAVKVILGKR